MENPKIIGLQEGNCVNFNIRNAIVTHAEALLLHAEGLLLQLEALLLHVEPLPEVVKVMPEHIDEKKLFFRAQPPYFALIPHGYWVEHREVGALDLPINLPIDLPMNLTIYLNK